MTRSSSILVVDDDISTASALQLILAAGNFTEIVLATTAEEAFELLDLADDAEGRPPRFDVILLDVIMPGMDGIAACARIRTTRRYRDVPILMCTGLSETESLNQAFIAGANDYLSKPFNKIELLARIRSAMRLKRELDRRRAREVELRKAQHRGEGDDDRNFDKVTGIPSQSAFNANVRRASARNTDHGILALQIAHGASFREEAGIDAFHAVVRKVAETVAVVPAPFSWQLSSYAEGLFLILAPQASASEMIEVGERARAAVDALQLAHGHSAEHDHVRLLTTWARGRGTELLALPAELIRSFDQPSIKPPIGRSTGPIAA